MTQGTQIIYGNKIVRRELCKFQQKMFQRLLMVPLDSCSIQCFVTLHNEEKKMPFFPNKTICVRPKTNNCLNKTGCFSTLRGHTVYFARPRLKFECFCQKFEIRHILLQNLQIRHMRPNCWKNCVLKPFFLMSACSMVYCYYILRICVTVQCRVNFNTEESIVVSLDSFQCSVMVHCAG